MLQTTELENDHIIRALRVLAADLQDKQSPFNKDENYLRNVGAWLATAASRLEQLDV